MSFPAVRVVLRVPENLMNLDGEVSGDNYPGLGRCLYQRPGPFRWRYKRRRKPPIGDDSASLHAKRGARVVEVEWGPASVQYGDWSGTVSMDSPDAWREIEEYARIDPEKWLIVGIELYGGSELGNERTWAWVLAIEWAEWKRMGSADGIRPGQRLEVTKFPVRESDAVGVLKAMKRFNIRASMRSVADTRVVIVNEVD